MCKSLADWRNIFFRNGPLKLLFLCLIYGMLFACPLPTSYKCIYHTPQWVKNKNNRPERVLNIPFLTFASKQPHFAATEKAKKSLGRAQGPT